MEDVITFPGRMYAFVNFAHAGDASRATAMLNDKEVPALTGELKGKVKAAKDP